MNPPRPAVGKLLTIQVGLPRMMRDDGTPVEDRREAEWQSGIYKDTVQGPVRVSTAGIAGDGQADPKHHGGPDNVVLAYDAAHYPLWRAELGRPDLAFGSFGENFTVEGFSDETVCIGDIWEVGSGQEPLQLQVTQPRQPCSKLARRIGTPFIVKRVKELGWGGWYLRVLRAGFAEAGMTIRLVARSHEEWPVRDAVWTMYGRGQDEEAAQNLAQLPELSRRWKEELLGF